MPQNADFCKPFLLKSTKRQEVKHGEKKVFSRKENASDDDDSGVFDPFVGFFCRVLLVEPDEIQ